MKCFYFICIVYQTQYTIYLATWSYALLYILHIHVHVQQSKPRVGNKRVAMGWRPLNCDHCL